MSLIWTKPDPMKLKAPPSWWALSEEERDLITDEAPVGPGRGVVAMLIPDDILGVDIRPAAEIHDYRYRAWSKGMPNKDLAKEIADNEYRHNLMVLIYKQKDAHHLARVVMVWFHYWFVKRWGKLPT